MPTLVLSDLHLGAAAGLDLLRRPDLRAPLLAALDGVERVVLLGDVVELRHAPRFGALEAARPFFAALGAALGSDGEIVLVPGNHDHVLVAPWLDRRREAEAPVSLGLSETIEPVAASPAAARLAEWAAPARARVAYPGVWLRPDVYAMHGHYLDRHVTVPTFERLGLGLVARMARRPESSVLAPDDYEAVLAPVYAFIDALTQYALHDGGEEAHGVSARAWSVLTGVSRRGLRRRLARAAFGLAVAGLNRAQLGPLVADVTGPELGRAGLAAVAQVLGRLDVRAAHVIFGHTHRSGPWGGHEARPGWTTSAGTRLWNTGSWLYERHFLTDRPNESPYWPGVAASVGDEGPPELRRLLGYRTHADLRPQTRPGAKHVA